MTSLGSSGNIMTLSRFMMEATRSNPDRADLESLMMSIQIATKTIAELISRAGTVDLAGNSASSFTAANSSNLYESANQILKNSLRFTGKLGVLAVSQEERNPILVEEDWNSKYIAVFDPLDGALNIDVGVVTGTIFGIFKEDEEDCLTDFGEEVRSASVKERLLKNLDCRKNMVASGYCMYSSSTVIMLTIGDGVYGFTLDPRIGEFVLSHPNVRIPQWGRIYSFNEANFYKWKPSFQTYVHAIKRGLGEQGVTYTSRYIGSLVGDIHRTLIYGGIYGYPTDSKRPTGKLGLLHEVGPMAFLVEQAGGKASTGYYPIRSVKPAALDETIGCFLGSYNDVSEVERVLSRELDW